MNRVARGAAVLAASAALLATGSSTAVAKGPTSAVIRGPGIDQPITVSAGDGREVEPRFAALVRDTGIFAGLWCRTCDERLAHAPSPDLGPRYTITYSMTIEGSEPSGVVEQYVFPDASPEPVTYVPRGQRFWGTESTVGGWFVARPRLRRLFGRLGVDLDPASVPPAPIATARGSGFGSMPFAAVVLLIAAAVGMVAAVRRVAVRRS